MVYHRKVQLAWGTIALLKGRKRSLPTFGLKALVAPVFFRNPTIRCSENLHRKLALITAPARESAEESDLTIDAGLARRLVSELLLLYNTSV